MNRFLALFFAALMLSGCSDQQPDRKQHYDLHIRNASVIDGSGQPAAPGDVLVLGGTIVYSGPVLKGTYRASKTIDATGYTLTPGFIDPHAHGLAIINPEFRNFWSMGVTTVALGMDGDSPGSEGLEGWFERVQAMRPGTNVIHFTGHGTARLKAGIGLNTTPNPAQLDSMVSFIRESIALGSFGLSTGLEYQPGIFASMDELIAIARPAAEADAVIMSHLRSEDSDRIAASVEELIAQGSGAGARVHVSHIKIVYGNDPIQAYELIGRMNDARDAGVEITADVYPYVASYTGIGIVFPDWALPPNNYETVKRTRRAELARYLRDRVNRRNGPEATLLGTGPWAGQTLAEVSAASGRAFEDILIDDIGPNGASAAYFVMNEQVMRTFLQDPFTLVSSDGSPTMLHPRGYGSFARIIRNYVQEEPLLTLEQAIHKMTGFTARVLRLDEGSDVHKRPPRGLVAEGFAADLLLFSPDKVRDTATFEAPHQFAEGFRYVWVNGLPVISEYELTGNRPGKVLRR